MILHRSKKITTTTIRIYENFSTIRQHENGADDKRHSSPASSKACEWVLAKKRENAEDQGKVTQTESLDYNPIPIHTLGDKLSNFYSRFSISCTTHFDHKKNHILPQYCTPSFSRR